MVDEILDEKQDGKVKNLIDSFLTKDAESTPPQDEPKNVEELEEIDDEQDDEEEHELTEEEKFLLARQFLDNKYCTISANLLGEFDGDGNYTISKFIMAELLAMPKLLDRNIDGTMELTCEYKDGTLFSFTATKPEIMENGDALTNLVINEKVEFLSGRKTQVLSTIVGSYLYKFTSDFDVKRMLVFNIYERDDPGIRARTPTDYIGLKLEYNKAVREAGRELFEKLEETYLNKHIQILNGVKNGPIVLSLFNEKRKLLEQKFAENPRGKFRALNDLLKQILQSPIAAEVVASPEYIEAMKSLNQKYMETAGKISAVIRENQAVKDLKRKREEKEAEQLGIYITEIMRTRGEHGPLVAGAIAEAKKQEAKKAAAKKAEKAAEKGKSGGGKKGGGKKGGSKKKKPAPKKKDDKKKIVPAFVKGGPVARKSSTIDHEKLARNAFSVEKKGVSGPQRIVGVPTAAGETNLQRTNTGHTRIGGPTM